VQSDFVSGPVVQPTVETDTRFITKGYLLLEDGEIYWCNVAVNQFTNEI